VSETGEAMGILTVYFYRSNNTYATNCNVNYAFLGFLA